jgi:hypothetical protein
LSPDAIVVGVLVGTVGLSGVAMVFFQRLTYVQNLNSRMIQRRAFQRLQMEMDPLDISLHGPHLIKIDYQTTEGYPLRVYTRQRWQ